MGITIHRDNDEGVLEDQILGSAMRSQFQKDAGSQSVIYSLPFDNQIRLFYIDSFFFASVFLICLQ